MTGSKGRVESVIEFRGNFFELLVVTIAIALGINLASTVLGSTLGDLWSVFLSAGLILIACVFLVLRLTPRVNRKLSLKGLFSLAKEDKKIIHIDRYEFSEEIYSLFRALFHENKALERIWSSSDLDFSPLRKHKGNANLKIAADGGKKLIREAIEYFILHRLSLDLSAYFNNNSEIEDGELVSISRNDIPSALLSNRFLDLLSKPIEERETFVSPKTTDQTDYRITEGIEGKLVYAITSEGAIYDHFELVLPRGTVISRPDDRSFVVDTKRFSLSFEVTFDGFGANLPSDFEELYIGTKFGDVRSYEVGVNIKVKFKFRSVFSRDGWQYYKWIDLFLENIEKEFSFDVFLKQISWDVAYSVATIMRRSNLPQRSRKSQI